MRVPSSRIAVRRHRGPGATLFTWWWCVGFLIIGMLVTPRAGDAGLNLWTTAGPEGGSITTLIVDPKTPSVLYAVGDAEGVFKSATAGAIWTPIHAGLADHLVLTVAIDPQTPATLYAGTSAGVFKSTNGGVSWSARSGGLGDRSIGTLAIDPQTPEILYAGDESAGVFKSTNGGFTWSASSTGLPNQSSGLSSLQLVIDPQTPSTLYAQTPAAGVFKSTDAGARWSASNTGLTQISVGGVPQLVTAELIIDPQTPTTLYVATLSRVGVSKTTNGGASWSASDTGIDTSTSFGFTTIGALAIDPQTPATLYATTGTKVFKSTNAGASWSLINTGFTTTLEPQPQ